MQATATRQRTTLGQGLMPDFSRKKRDAALLVLGAAYSSIKDNRKENWTLWEFARRLVGKTLRAWYARQGLTAAPWAWDALWARVDLPYPSPQPLEHLRLVRALSTSYQARFSEQFEYRWNTEANVQLSWRGLTGLGKSSCAVATADWFLPIESDGLLRHLAYDLTELPSKLKALKAGETIILDENIRLAGEGASTARSLLDNLEDTLRKSQRNLFVVTPSSGDHATMHAEMEGILWNPDQHYTVFLCWLDGVPHGVVAVPWMRTELYEVYKRWKDANVEKSVAGTFRDNAYLWRMVLRLFADERFVRYMMEMVNKPKKADFKEGLTLFAPQMMAGAQAEALVNFTFNVCKSFHRTEKQFKELSGGLEPNDGLRRVALKWYKE